MGLRQVILLAAAAVASAMPARAATFDFTFFAPPPSQFVDVTVSGGGFFSAPDGTTVGLSDLTGFFFTWSVTGLSGSPPIPFSASLTDLVSFSATVSGNTVASLALLTRLVPSPSPQLFNPQLFSVGSLAPNGAFTSPNPTPDTIGVGTVSVVARAPAGGPSPIPEPSGLALVGVGLAALAASRARRRDA